MKHSETKDVPSSVRNVFKFGQWFFSVRLERFLGPQLNGPRPNSPKPYACMEVSPTFGA